MPFVGTGEDDRPWYRIISEKAHKEKLWEVNDIISESSMALKFAAKKQCLFLSSKVMTRVMEVYAKETELLEPLIKTRWLSSRFLILMHFADFQQSLHCVTHSRGSVLTRRMSWGVHPRPILTHAQRVCRMYKKVSISVYPFLLYNFRGRLWEPPKIGQSAVTCSALMPASLGQGIGSYS